MTMTTEEQKLYEDLEVLVWGSPATMLKRRAERALRAVRLGAYAKAIERIAALRDEVRRKGAASNQGTWVHCAIQTGAYDSVIASLEGLKRELEATS